MRRGEAGNEGQPRTTRNPRTSNGAGFRFRVVRLARGSTACRKHHSRKQKAPGPAGMHPATGTGHRHCTEMHRLPANLPPFVTGRHPLPDPMHRPWGVLHHVWSLLHHAGTPCIMPGAICSLPPRPDAASDAEMMASGHETQVPDAAGTAADGKRMASDAPGAMPDAQGTMQNVRELM